MKPLPKVRRTIFILLFKQTNKQTNKNIQDIEMHLYSPTDGNQLQHWICFFFFQYRIFFLELNKKTTLDSDFIRGTEYPKI